MSSFKLKGFSDGNPWHMEKMVRAEGDERRHRTYCFYYNQRTKQCTYYISVCRGAAHCKQYSVIEQEFDADNYQTELPDAPKASSAPKVSICLDKIKVGSRVTHKVYKNGYVSEISNDRKRINVTFEDGTHKFILPDAFEKGFLKLNNT